MIKKNKSAPKKAPTKEEPKIAKNQPTLFGFMKKS